MKCVDFLPSRFAFAKNRRPLTCHAGESTTKRAPTEADALRMPLPLLDELAAADAEREEADRAPAHALCCHHCAADNTTACLTSAGNNASASEHPILSRG